MQCTGRQRTENKMGTCDKVTKHYRKFVEWSDVDHCFIGRCPELILGGVHGQDEVEVYRELCQVVEEKKRHRVV